MTCNEGMVEVLWHRFVSESIRIEPTIVSPATFSGAVTRISLSCFNNKHYNLVLWCESVPQEASKPDIH